MFALVPQWPVWYWLLAAYTVGVALVRAVRALQSHESVRELLELLLRRGAHGATVRFQLRKDPARGLLFTKYLRGGIKRNRLSLRYATTAEFFAVSTFSESRQDAGALARLEAALLAKGVRSNRERGRRGRVVLRADHGRDVTSMVAMVDLVFGEILGVDVVRAGEAKTTLILDNDTPRVTGFEFTEDSPPVF